MKSDTLQGWLDSLYERVLAEEITRDEYRLRLNQIEDKYPEIVNGEFSQRQDKRRLGDMGVDFLIFMDNEKASADWWMATYGELHLGTSNFEYSGIEASGRLLTKSEKSKDQFKLPDLKILPEGDEPFYLELKYNCKSPAKQSYKLFDLRSYHALKEDVWTLTISSWDEVFSPEEVAYFTLLDPDQFDVIMKKLTSDPVLRAEENRIPVGPLPEFGNKPGIQFWLFQSKGSHQRPMKEYFSIFNQEDIQKMIAAA